MRDNCLWLPAPSDDAVRRFQELARDRLGMELDDVSAREEATRVLHMVYLREHVFPSIRQETGRTEVTDPVPRPKPKIGRPRKKDRESQAARDPSPPSEPQADMASGVDPASLAVGESVSLYDSPKG